MTTRTGVPAVFLAALLVLLALPPAARAQERSPDLAGITVQGTGEVRVRPDIARLSLGVQTQGPDSTRAAQENAALTRKVIAAIRAAGVAEKDIQTQNYSIYPQYEQRPVGGAGGGEPRPPRIVGYQVSNTVAVVVRKIADVGKVIDGAVRAGANVAGGISFDLDDPTKAREEAMRKAVADALRKGRVMAEAASVGGLRLVSLVEGGVNYPRSLYEAANLARADVGGTPVAAGEQTITATVTARFAMGGR